MSSDSQDSSNVIKRSFFSAYGPIIIVSVLVILAFAILFLSNKPQDQKSEVAIKLASTPPPGMGREDIGKRVQEVMQRTKGDINKATGEEKEYISRISQGHATDMFNTYKEKLSGNKEPQKVKEKDK
jgi:hypothetical protein